MTKENPPEYEAYKSFLEGRAFFGVDYEKANVAYRKAIEIDPDYFWPYVDILIGHSNRGQMAEADSILQLIDARFDRLMPYEQLYYDWVKVVLTQDLEASYLATQKLFQADPKQPINNYLMGHAASIVNRPAKTVEYLQYIDPSTITVEDQVMSWWHSVYATNLIRLNRLDEAMEILRWVPIEKANNTIFYRKQEIFALRNQGDSIKQMIAELETRNFPVWWINEFYVESIEEFALQNNWEQQMHWARLSIDKIRSKPEAVPLDKDHLAAAYFLGEQYDKALPLYLEVSNNEPTSPFLLMRLAGCYAHLGEDQEASAIIEQMISMAEPRDGGRSKYNIGKVFAMLGEKEKATQYLRLSHREGYHFSPGAFQNAFELIGLRGYPPFEEFVRPKD